MLRRSGKARKREPSFGILPSFPLQRWNLWKGGVQAVLSEIR